MVKDAAVALVCLTSEAASGAVDHSEILMLGFELWMQNILFETMSQTGMKSSTSVAQMNSNFIQILKSSRQL